MHAHAETAGCKIVPHLVESVGCPADGEGFVVEPQDGDSVTARRVIAATRYEGEYMRELDDVEGMFETIEHKGEDHDYFSREYADHDGTTPVEGLYIASPSKAADRQTILAAGRGARVAHRVIADVRIADGWWEDVAETTDWVRHEAELDDESAVREHWRERFDEQVPDDHDVSEERLVELREAEIDRRLETYIESNEIDARATAGQRELLEHIEDDLVLERAREINSARDSLEASD
jgi:hypothetical protein